MENGPREFEPFRVGAGYDRQKSHGADEENKAKSFEGTHHGNPLYDHLLVVVPIALQAGSWAGVKRTDGGVKT